MESKKILRNEKNIILLLFYGLKSIVFGEIAKILLRAVAIVECIGCPRENRWTEQLQRMLLGNIHRCRKNKVNIGKSQEEPRPMIFLRFTAKRIKEAEKRFHAA
jgi:hypothetical protein